MFEKASILKSTTFDLIKPYYS